MTQDKRQGYNIDEGYMGLINGEYKLFSTEVEYNEYFNELHNEDEIIAHRRKDRAAQKPRNFISIRSQIQKLEKDLNL